MKHMSKQILACLLIVALLLTSGIAMASSASTCKVTATKLFLRAEATSDSEALLSIRQGKVLEILGKTGKWYKVAYGNYTGYVYADYVELIEDGTLADGSKGDSVKQLQQRLKELGYYDSSCDGNYGTVTVNAVKAFQKKNGLSQTGIADEKTQSKLYSSSAIKANGKAAASTAETDEDSAVLKKGSKGSAVKQLQERLKQLGYYKSTCDGDYGNNTVTAVKAFQKKNGLSQTGTADEKTLDKIYSTSAVTANGKVDDAVAEDSTLKKGSKGNEVKKLQQRLKELGYYKATCDGDYGSGTVTAVKAFQKKNGLSQTGTADSATLKKLNSSSAIAANEKVEEETDITDTLKRGSKGTAVKELQKRLKELGYYNNTCDGEYGSGTVAAVKAFQKKNGLTQTGTADATTLKKVYSTSAISANDKEEAADTTTTLKRGDKGEAVKELQRRLKELGYYNSTIDGEYGSGTVSAVKAFQKKNSLSQTGTADSATLKKVYSTSAISANDKENTADTTTTLKRGSKGEAVKELQRRLKELGYYKSTIDGEYGSGTVSAVKAFQKKNGLTQSGTADAATLKKVYSSSAIGATENTDTNTTTTLKRGDKGEAVKELQKRLKELGYYNTVVDSEYGSGTVNAVKAFQKKNGLSQTGIADSATLKKVYSTTAIGAKDTTTEDNDTTDTTDTLKRGSKGAAVKELQKRLKELGYYTTVIDSEYGSGTVSAVKAFQKKNGLSQTGVADSATLKKVYSSSAIGAKDNTDDDKVDTDGTLKQGSSGEAVRKVQQRLKELGYYTTTCDGDYGSKTITAVKAFQKKNGLSQTGVCDAATLNKLNSDSALNASGGDSSTTLNTNQTLESGDNGTQVKLLQQRLKELGYYTTAVDSDYGYRTASAVSAFQRANGLTVTGTANSTTLKKMMSSSAVTKADADKKNDDTKTYVTERLDWFKNGKAKFPNGAIIQIKDVKTGYIFKAKVLFGTNHLDAEPLTKADTNILLKINGGVEFKHYRRPMLVKYNGHVYAASIYSEPHGDQNITDNNFDGQFCLHFYKSKTHGTGVVDSDHQAAVAEAMKATW